jgi:hypothetical protein
MINIHPEYAAIRRTNISMIVNGFRNHGFCYREIKHLDKPNLLCPLANKSWGINQNNGN